VTSVIQLKTGHHLQQIASGSYDRTIKISEISTGSLVRTLSGHSSYVLCLTNLLNGNLVSGSADTTIKVKFI